MNTKYLSKTISLGQILNLKSFIAVNPSKLNVKLTGKIKETMNFLEGVYLLQRNLINGKCHWIIEDGTLAIWYDKNDGKEAWNIGGIENLGSQTVALYSSGDSNKPLEDTTWKYFDEDSDKWHEITGVFIVPIPSKLEFFLLPTISLNLKAQFEFTNCSVAPQKTLCYPQRSIEKFNGLC